MSEELPAEAHRSDEVTPYATEDGQAHVFVHAEGGTLWLSQAEPTESEKFKRQSVKSGETDAA